jgi:hypothetical protein
LYLRAKLAAQQRGFSLLDNPESGSKNIFRDLPGCAKRRLDHE